MSDTAGTTTETTTDEPKEPQGDDGTDWKAEARKWEDRAKKDSEKAKAAAAALKELEQIKQQSMSDAEKAVAQAKAEARAEALAEVGSKLAAAELRAHAAGRLTDDQLATLTDGLNLAKFLDDDGEVDTAKVAAFVDGIAPKVEEEEKPAGFPDLGQGKRSDIPLNGDPMLRDVKNALGIN